MAKSTSGIDLSKLAAEELEALINNASEALQHRKEEELEKAREECRGIAEAVGETVESLFGFRARKSRGGAAAAGGRRKSKAEPKYQNPDNAAETWTGRGRKPVWFQQQIDNGVAADDMLIK